MFRKIKIGSKITAVLLTVVTLTIAAVSFITYNFSKKALEEKYTESLSVILKLKKDKITYFFEQAGTDARVLRRSDITQSNLEWLTSGEDSLTQMATDRLDNFIAPYFEAGRYHNILLAGADGQVYYSYNRNVISSGSYLTDPDGVTFAKGTENPYFSHIFKQGDAHYLLHALPMQGGGSSAMLIMQIDMAPIYTVLSDTTGLGNTGEVLIGREKNNKAIFLNPLRHDEGEFLTKGVYIGEKAGVPLQKAVSGESGIAIDTDYRKQEILAAWDYIPSMNWGIVTKIDTAEIYGEVENLLWKFLMAGAIILVLATMIAFIFSRILIDPVLDLKGTLSLLGKGVLPDKVKKKSNDEIGEMAGAIDNLVQSLKRTARFAHQIGKGDFDADFQPLSQDDTLGTALINMRESIQEAEKRDKERNWIVTGVAELGNILRAHDDLEKLGDEITAFVSEKIGAIQGAFYVVNDDDPNDVFIEMKASYAYHKKKYLSGRYRFAEGLVGQAAIEQDTLLRTEIPHDYVTVTSGLLGDQRPTCLLLVPLITDEKVYGVLEFAGFNRFNASQVKFVQEISLIIARTIFNIKVNERTRNLLEESQHMSNELQEQQEILRQNAEEMEATQEELRRTNQQLEDQIEEVNRGQKRMQLLLENASEVIMIYESDNSVRYVSPSVERILGYSQQELVGRTDLEHVDPDYRDVFEDMFKDLHANPADSVTIQYVYHRKDGEDIWLEATGKNLLSDPAIQGILINTRDITERRRAEQEQRMRSQMQALSENSPDLITRLNDEGSIFYINPTIESYTGYNPTHFLQKNITETDLEQRVVDQWLNILQTVGESNEKVKMEMDFPSPMGPRIMQVNAIPEFNEENKFESVLVVSHDITERKHIELEIQNKNKKITESINYAKRIQGAILPDNHVIRRRLPESFIFYKARDVVSGDFPWYMQMGDDLYIAAVDCTGHGVPGALISLIGYFLLNDIVRSRKVSDPGVILDLLDEGVTQTLRQDRDDSKTKDGMDIALCKINTKTNELQYAGAHRPLYVMKEGELEEIKGNRFPIGGGRYKNQTNFTNTTLEMKEGDSVFFCSDGFPDQFGGPDNRKFGPKRLRNLIRETQHLPMEEMHDVFDREWEGWRGDHKQTDDVLLIGIRF
ncbi:PAS domain S-box protein [Roseivirga sp. BDSF3-8]|uniref:PAS domain S-box protein n=1 Tax=Roseivirga sp. BDSF3-8 TaxID=3241598 RepID=UPI0035323058